MANPAQGFPGVPQGTIANKDGTVTPVWLQFFLALWNRTGGAAGSASIILDTITSNLGALLVRAAAGWQGIDPGAQNKILKMGATLPSWDLVDGSSFATEARNRVFAGPGSGEPANPAFRPLVYQDLEPGEFPGTATNDDAIAGNLGEYVASEIDSGSAVALATGVISDITSIALAPGDWDLWAGAATTAAVTTAKGWISTVSATDPAAPNAGAYAQWGAQIFSIPLGMMRLSLANPTTIYLSIDATFTGSLSAYGFLGARRRR